MNAMHTRRDDYFAQQPFETNRQPQIAVMKEHLSLEGQLIRSERPTRQADHAEREKIEHARKRDLAKVKSKRGRNVQVGFDVVEVVDPPQERHSMIRDMPVIKGQVH